MNIVDSIKLKGVFECKIYKVINGEYILQEEYIDNNVIVNVGKEKITKLLGNDVGFHHIQSISFGTSNVNPTVVDTTITNDFNKGFVDVEYPDIFTVKFIWELLVDEANGKAITEFGLICSDGTLFARKIRGVILKESDVYLSGSWSIRVL